MRLNSFLNRAAIALACCVTAVLTGGSWAQTPRDPNAANSYEAPASFESGPQLKAHIERLQRVPITQRSTGNYYEQYVKTADRILEHKTPPPESLREFAVIHLLDGLQQWADVGKNAEADKRLAEVAEKYRNDPNKRLAIAAGFFNLEQRVLNPGNIDPDQVPKVLDEVKAALGSRGLNAKYVRIANGTNTLINYLGTDEEAEKRFKEFGRIFSASSDATISKLGNTMKTAKRDASLRTTPAASVAEAAATPDGSVPAEKPVAVEPADKWITRIEAQLPNLGGAANDAAWDKEKSAFMIAYPESPLRWQWFLMDARRAMNNPADRAQGMAIAKGSLYSVIAAPDAPAATRELASVMKLRLDIAGRTNSIELTQAIDEHMKAFPNSAQNAALASAAAVAVTFDKPEEDALISLEQLKATGAAPVVAAATARMAIVEKLIQLKSNPLELKFAALDSQEFDLEKLRGKVVLLDFGATWSKPWVDGLPELKELYKKYHDQGLEIVSISFDQDKQALETFIKSQDLPWTHFFDGKVWETPLAKTYGMNSLPALWLIGKDGKVVDFRARDQLAVKLEPLMQ